MITQSEIEFYQILDEHIEIIFDVGCREDTDYLDISAGKEFHLFEPNPDFYKRCEKKIDYSKNSVFLNKFGLGKKTESLDYYLDAQSFVKRVRGFQTNGETLLLEVRKFTEYLTENNIEKIDFLKIDAEGFEPDILLDNIEYIKNNVDYIQFEYASTWFDRDDGIDLEDICEIYEDTFSFHFLYDPDHPVSRYYENLLTELDEIHKIKAIESYANMSFGSNIVMLRWD